MKAINIVLSILILLLSAAAAVFSYFLYEKRSQFVTGWDKMAEIVSESAKALDQGSGTNLGSKLTKDALSHKNYANLDSLKGELPKQSKNIITERNVLAKALSVISRTVNPAGSVTEAQLTKLDTYNVFQRRVTDSVADAVRKRNMTYRNIVYAAKRGLNVNIDNKLLLNGDAKAFTALTNELASIRSRSAYYESSIAQIGKRFGASVSVNARSYRTEVPKVVSSIDKYLGQTRKLNQELDQLKRNVRSLNATIGRLNNQIKAHKATIDDRNSQIVSFQRAFGLPASRGEANPWKPGSKESRQAVVGKIIAVNTKFGYVAVDFGKYSVVEQKIGNRTLEINPVIEPGVVLAVSRQAGAKSDFIARLQISQVGENSSIANIPVDAKPIKVGDIVRVVIEDEKASAKKSGK